MNPPPRPAQTGGPVELAVYIHRNGATDAELIDAVIGQVQGYLAKFPPRIGALGKPVTVTPGLMEATARWVAAGAVQPNVEVVAVPREGLIFQVGHTWALVSDTGN